MTVNIASSPQESDAAESIVRHHQSMLDEARALTEQLMDGSPSTTALGDWYQRVLLPHAVAEEEVLYAAARPLAAPLIDAMVLEHAALRELLDELRSVKSPVRVAAAAGALLALLESHIAKENDIVVPLLSGAADVRLNELLQTMHGRLDEAPEHTEASHDCTCDEPTDDLPVLDARAVPHAIRHATVFGALDAIRPGKGLVLVAPHDPLPLLAQLERRSPDAFDVAYRQRGPEAWRLTITRKPADG
jgi:uncharacterized protein (DUF2249 family)/hemerythrin-like domain-containing protein